MYKLKCLSGDGSILLLRCAGPEGVFIGTDPTGKASLNDFDGVVLNAKKLIMLLEEILEEED